MAFGVRKWPGPCDPRSPCFCLLGYAFGAVPPNRFRMITTGALFPYLELNVGLLLPFTVESPGGT